MLIKDVRYQCVNKDCVWADQVRIVPIRVLAPGLYEKPVDVVCDCGYPAKKLPDLGADEDQGPEPEPRLKAVDH